MIAWLQGIVLEKKAPYILLDVSGVGYQVMLPMSSFYHLPEVGEQATLFIHHHIREDNQSLFGFTDTKAKELFQTLLKVNGLGPKLALTILSGMSVSDFLQAVQHKDLTKLTKLPGVGKKTAERMLVELSDRLKGWFNADSETSIEPTAQVVDHLQDAIEALIALGYKASDASRALASYRNDDYDSQTLIRKALQALAA